MTAATGFAPLCPSSSPCGFERHVLQLPCPETRAAHLCVCVSPHLRGPTGPLHQKLQEECRHLPAGRLEELAPCPAPPSHLCRGHYLNVLGWTLPSWSPPGPLQPAHGRQPRQPVWARARRVNLCLPPSPSGFPVTQASCCPTSLHGCTAAPPGAQAWVWPIHSEGWHHCP